MVLRHYNFKRLC